MIKQNLQVPAETHIPGMKSKKRLVVDEAVLQLSNDDVLF